MPAPAAAFTPVPITEGDYAFICHITGYHLGSDPAEDAMIMSDLWDVLSDRSFRISLADGSFDSGYHITGVFGKLGFADGEPPVPSCTASAAGRGMQGGSSPPRKGICTSST